MAASAGSSSIGSGNSSSFGGGGGGGEGVGGGQQTKHAVTATTIELPSHKHHRHCQLHTPAGSTAEQSVVDRGKSLPRRQNNNNSNICSNTTAAASPSNRPNDSHYSDIRKSAPDVIVMTSR